MTITRARVEERVFVESEPERIRSPGWKRQRRELYVLPLRQSLLVVPIPLRERESPVMLDLQALVEQVYEIGRYDDLGYGTELDPQLAGEDAARAV